MTASQTGRGPFETPGAILPREAGEHGSGNDNQTHGNKRRRFRLVSPLGFLALAAIMLVAFLVCHLCGFRTDVSAMFATSAHDSSGAVARGGLYVLTYLLAVLAAPILAIAAGIMAALQFVVARSLLFN